jgi:hypothetical protein
VWLTQYTKALDDQAVRGRRVSWFARIAMRLVMQSLAVTQRQSSRHTYRGLGHERCESLSLEHGDVFGTLECDQVESPETGAASD